MIYDHLVNRELLQFAPGGAERVYVGKQGGRDHISQTEINSLLLERAHQGKTVARLKGGDPFIFGRGGEEAEVLAGPASPSRSSQESRQARPRRPTREFP